jgi:hypothetical protein
LAALLREVPQRDVVIFGEFFYGARCGSLQRQGEAVGI